MKQSFNKKTELRTVAGALFLVLMTSGLFGCANANFKASGASGSQSLTYSLSDELSASLVIDSVECDNVVQINNSDPGIVKLNERFRLKREGKSLTVVHADVIDGCNASIKLKNVSVDGLDSWIVDQVQIHGCTGIQRVDDYSIGKEYAVLGLPAKVFDSASGGGAIRMEVYAPPFPNYVDSSGVSHQVSLSCHTMAVNLVPEPAPLSPYGATFFELLL
jgi:hypothetical protein